MNRNDEGGYVLDDRQIKALCFFLLSRVARDISEGYGPIEWESVPELSEGSWEALQYQFGLTAARLMQTAHVYRNIDPRFIWEQVT